jgi:hypothetical protein
MVKVSPILNQIGFQSNGSPQVGFKPTTSQLTTDHSTTELLRNNGGLDPIYVQDSCSLDRPMTSALTIETLNKVSS